MRLLCHLRSFVKHSMAPAKMQCKEVNKANIKEFLSTFDNVLVDCDGVLWHGNVPITGASDTLSKFREMGKKVFFVTNNSTKTRDEFLKKFHSLGFQANSDEIFSTAYAAASYLKSLGFNKKVYVMGTKGVTQELDLVGIRHIGAGADVMDGNVIDWVLHGVELDSEVGAVVVGFDEHVSYPKILKAASYLNDPQCIFLGTNTDERFPIDKSTIVMPGAGSILASVRIAAEREPIVLGKPFNFLFDAIVDVHGIRAERTIMIGDRLNTDILLGHNCGLLSLLVLTGISTLNEVHANEQSDDPRRHTMVPTYYVPSLGDIVAMTKG